jgi:tetratricopeptide (TPR) repeat protein
MRRWRQKVRPARKSAAEAIGQLKGFGTETSYRSAPHFACWGLQMTSRISIAAGLVLGLAANFLAMSFAAAGEPTASAPPAAAEPQWQKDQDLDKGVWADMQSGGLRAVAPHASDMERALANAKQTMASATSADGSHVVFTDGGTETMIALGAIVPDKSGPAGRIEAQENHYLGMGLLLGSYYNEIGKFDDALRVLDLALTLDAVQTGGLGMGEHIPLLVSEKGAALAGLKRWPDALASYDAVLKINDLDDAIHAHALRGRGYALTELNRLDDAEQAYNDSLKYEPGNARAQSELRYIARLRAGAPPVASSGLAPLQRPTAPTSGTAPPSAAQPAPTTPPTN